jgi:hypothetical protein
MEAFAKFEESSKETIKTLELLAKDTPEHFRCCARRLQ